MKEKLILNEQNYHSKEARLTYLDCSTYKNVVGTPGRKGCECRALAIAKGEYVEPKTEALMVGGYVDAFFDNSLAQFCADNMDDIFTKASIKKFDKSSDPDDLERLKAFEQADIMIKRAKKEPMFMRYVEGETQKILIAEIEGVPIRVKLDSYDGKRITDIKTAASITETYYAKDLGQRLNFAEYFGYIEQAYFYVTAVEQNFGKHLPFYLAVITKEKHNNEPHPRVAVIQIPDKVIMDKGAEIKAKIKDVWSLIQGEYDPIPCGTCEWCADNLPLEKVISLDELMLEV
jgi:hypothetical protein